MTATRRITEDPQLSGVRVVMLTTFVEEEDVFAALRSGASGFLVKDADPDELVQAVRIVARGDALLSPSVTRAGDRENRSVGGSRPRPSRAGNHPRSPRSPTGSGRWSGWLAEGLSNEDIAARLVVSPLTAKTHVSRAMAKVGARDRAQLVVVAYQSLGWSTRLDELIPRSR